MVEISCSMDHTIQCYWMAILRLLKDLWKAPDLIRGFLGFNRNRNWLLAYCILCYYLAYGIRLSGLSPSGSAIAPPHLGCLLCWNSGAKAHAHSESGAKTVTLTQLGFREMTQNLIMNCA